MASGRGKLLANKPQDRVASEASLVAEAGPLDRRAGLGAVGAALAARAPAVVRVVVPEAARVLAFRPLELAVVEGRPLAVQGITLVWQVRRETRRGEAAGGGAAAGAGVVQLAGGRQRAEPAPGAVRAGPAAAGGGRGERPWGGVAGAAVRGDPGAAAGGGAGGGGLGCGAHLRARRQRRASSLEHPDGRPDPVSSAELVALLAPAARQVKLVTASACSSAELTAREHLRLLGLSPPTREGAGGGNADGGAEPAGPRSGDGEQDGGLVRALRDRAGGPAGLRGAGDAVPGGG